MNRKTVRLWRERFSRDGLQSLWEIAPGRGRKTKVVLADGFEIADVYRLAAEHDIQIRYLAHKKDSLEDIFMAAMEAG